MFNTNYITKTIKYCMMDDYTKLILEVNNEKVYRVFVGQKELINTLDRKTAEDKYEHYKLMEEE